MADDGACSSFITFPDTQMEWTKNEKIHANPIVMFIYFIIIIIIWIHSASRILSTILKAKYNFSIELYK